MRCDAKIDGYSIELLLDSGASGSIVTEQFLKKINRKIDRQIKVALVGINGEKTRPLGEVVDLPIKIQNNIMPINAVVTEATDYDVLVGNDWLTKCEAVLSWPDERMTYRWKGRTAEVPITCWTKSTRSPVTKEEIPVTLDEEDEYEEEEIEEKPAFKMDCELEVTPQIVRINDNLWSPEVLEWAKWQSEMQKEDEDIELSEEETQWLPYLRAEDFKVEEKEGLTLKYFDNNGEGKKPEKAHDTDAGLDLYYFGNESLLVPAGKITAVDTQVAIEIPKNFYAQISTQSLWAVKGIHTVGGVCDAGYTGDII